MQSLSGLPPDFVRIPHCALMSAAQILATLDSAKAECVMSRAAPSAAMHVNSLILDVLRLAQARRRATRCLLLIETKPMREALGAPNPSDHWPRPEHDAH